MFFVESAGLCPNNDTASVESVFLITFDYGPENFCTNSPSSFNFNTSYRQVFANFIEKGEFGFVNAVPDHRGNWHGGAKDHTSGDNDGYLFLLNIADNGSLLFQYKIDHLCIGAQYEFSTHLANVVKGTLNLYEPSVLFEARSSTGESDVVLAQAITDSVPESKTMTWVKHGLLFNASTESIILSMMANGGVPSGNDLAIDDIALRLCTASHTVSCPSGEYILGHGST